MKKIIFMFALATISVLWTGCKNNDEPKTRLGDVFTVKYGQSVSLDNGMKISFSDVVSDNRLPLGICYLAYGSSANIELSLSLQGKTYSIPMGIYGCNGTDIDHLYDQDSMTDTLGYEIHLYRLDPYPDGLSPIEMQDYSVKLKINQL